MKKNFQGLDKILRKYNSVGFTITVTRADNELKPFVVKVKNDLDVTMNYSNPGYYVPDIDRNNIAVKERYCAQYHRLPFQNILKVMIIFLDF